MPKNMKKLKFRDIDAAEFVRRLTIIESRLYGKIVGSSRELVSQIDDEVSNLRQLNPAHLAVHNTIASPKTERAYVIAFRTMDLH